MNAEYSMYAKKTCDGEYEVSFTPRILVLPDQTIEPACVIAVIATLDGTFDPTITKKGHPLVSQEELDRKTDHFKEAAVEAVKQLAVG